MLSTLLLVPALIAAAPAPSLRPVWISVLPVQPGRVYGLGVAALTTDAAALREAADNARADVISRLRASVQADTRVSTVLQETRASGGAAAGSRTQTTQVCGQGSGHGQASGGQWEQGSRAEDGEQRRGKS